jgi:hypothetical protein
VKKGPKTIKSSAESTPNLQFSTFKPPNHRPRSTVHRPPSPIRSSNEKRMQCSPSPVSRPPSSLPIPRLRSSVVNCPSSMVLRHSTFNFQPSHQVTIDINLILNFGVQ